MVSTATLISCVIAMLICILLPPAIGLLYAAKNRGQKIISAWLLGAAGFFVTQMVIRVPILTVLQMIPGFQAFSKNHGFLYVFAMAFTAGLFELAGRFVVAKVMHKKSNLSCARGFAAGLGHGGIEAMLLVSMTYLNNILYIFMINSGTFDGLVAQSAQTGVDVSALWQIKDQLLNANPALFLLGVYERILAMICHLAMSLMVCYGIHTGKPLKSSLICLIIHTMIDLSAGINMLAGTVLPQTAAYVIIYSLLTVTAILSVLIILNIRRRWPKTEVNHV